MGNTAVLRDSPLVRFRLNFNEKEGADSQAEQRSLPSYWTTLDCTAKIPGHPDGDTST